VDAVRTLVIDDVGSYRALLSDVLGNLDGVEVVGVAATGKTGLSRIATEKPDLIVVDAGLADIDVEELVGQVSDQIGVILVDGDDPQSDTRVLEKRLSAIGAVSRPKLSDAIARDRLSFELRRLIDGFHTRLLLRGSRRHTTTSTSTTDVPTPKPPVAPRPVEPAVSQQRAAVSAPKMLIPDLPLDVIAIGISTGGPNALAVLLPELPKDLPVPILIVQHITDTFTTALVNSLDGKCDLAIREGADGEVPAAGNVYIAPGGRQMKVEGRADERCLRLTDDPPVNHCRPAVDYLFESLATVYGAKALGVIMTGMGADGTAGLRAMHGMGSLVLAQDEETSMVHGMPGSALRAGVVDLMLPLQELAPQITRLAMHGRARS
jgi:two-component system, chemotaxis family, protein-glutamate methylesterase/glutaminase